MFEVQLVLASFKKSSSNLFFSYVGFIMVLMTSADLVDLNMLLGWAISNLGYQSWLPIVNKLFSQVMRQNVKYANCLQHLYRRQKAYDCVVKLFEIEITVLAVVQHYYNLLSAGGVLPSLLSNLKCSSILVRRNSRPNLVSILKPSSLIVDNRGPTRVCML